MFPQPSAYISSILAELRRQLADPAPDDAKYRAIWYRLCYYRAAALGQLLKNTVGRGVQSGPFKDMQLTDALLATVSAPAPHLLGTYEHELHPAIEAAIVKPYRTILNIGCNHGYYAVGFARRMPQTDVLGFEIEPAIAEQARAMAALNDVSARVTIAGLFRGEDFARYADRRTLVFMDIEGAEVDLLDPQRYPALRQMDIIVELHALLDPNLPGAIVKRLADSHVFEAVLNKPALFDFTPLVGAQQWVDPVDSLLATWEGRSGPTPWGIFRAKAFPA